MVYTRIVQPGIRKKYHYVPGERTLFRVEGTIIPKVWKTAVLVALLTLALCFVYDELHHRERHTPAALSSRERLALHLFRDAEKILAYLTGFLTFILGFFNSIVFARWWRMRELCGNVIEAAQNSAMHIAIFVVRRPADDAAGEAELERTRHELVRLIGLAVALVLQACHRVRDLDWLAENELLERGSAEHAALEEIAGPGYNEVIGWAVDATYEAGARKMVAPEVLSSVLYSVRWALTYMSNHAEDLMMHLNQPIPLAYYNLLETMVCIYIAVAAAALVPSLLWAAVAVSPVVTLFFYGFFTLGTSMLMDPFVKDSGFDTLAFIKATMLSMDSLERNVPLRRRVASPKRGSFNVFADDPAKAFDDDPGPKKER